MEEGMAAEATTQGKPASGWVQPEHRRCGHLHVSGARCRATTQTGDKFCYQHRAWNDTDPMYPIKVPLLEDPDAIRFVISQTVRALGMGTLPSANGRAMMGGCRMAMGLLQHELAVEKFRARSEHRAQSSEHRVPETECAESRATGDGLSQAAGDGLQGAEGGAESDRSLESDASQNQAEMGHPDSAGPRIVPRFPDLREQWDKSVDRAAVEVARNVQRREDEDGEEWLQRQARAIEAGHPHVRTGPARHAIPSARRQDLPFDPMCPPAWDHATMKDWPKEHMAAWFRALSPSVTQLDVREFVRGMWEIPRADEKAGWPGRREGAAPREDCIFRTMTMEEIAGWVKKEIPDMPTREAKEYAEERTRGMGRREAEPASRADGVRHPAIGGSVFRPG